METSIYQFLKSVDEYNRACEMALRYAALILADFRGLSQEGRKIMADMLMDLILVEGAESREWQ
ncbi:MAG: hypothetical protein H8E80_01030 [Desulfobacteraceae bacterium]|uniref:Uncharacterized protein n=1 Tax=Candidatus Desulfaltia bathyphila TaxID=2841697 RepID=A0A8J6N314_9BACT|nr:hypothetical protein [Candidatus Desulfaltia bathyphila]MBL7196389.1 hypothetical protein [Desulfobacterales bacterium]